MEQLLNKTRLRWDLPPEMFEAEIEPYLKERNLQETADIYRFILAIGLLKNDMSLVDIACDWMFSEVESNYLSSESAMEIYREVLDCIAENELVTNMFAQTAVGVGVTIN